MKVNGLSQMQRMSFQFAGKSSRDYFLFLSGPGVYNAPQSDISATSVPGQNGDILIDNARSGYRRYENVTVKYKAAFFSGLPAKTSAVKAWLLSPVGYQVLADDYDPDFFRKAVCMSALTFDVKNHHRAAEFSIEFNCKPQRYAFSGKEKVEIATSGETIYNPYEFPSLPQIRVYGSGEGKLQIGDFTVNIYDFGDDGYVDLDSETQNATNSSGFCNTSIYSQGFPILAAGSNEIIWTGEITSVVVTPNWWTL